MTVSVSAVIAVAAGCALGAVSRWGLSLCLMGLFPGPFAWPSFAVNIIGSILIGVLAGAASVVTIREWPERRLAFWLPGFCGGFTSFSIFSLDSVKLLSSGQGGLAGVYLLASLLLWILGVAMGWWLGRRLGNTAAS